MSDPATLRLQARVPEDLRHRIVLRAVRDEDGPELTALVAAAYDEYACGPLDPDEFDADLAAPATSARVRGRRWWVVTGTDRPDHPAVLGSVAHGPLGAGPEGTRTVELHRLYLAPALRGSGLATALVMGIAAEAHRLGAGTLLAWSDTRLTDAHRRYVTLGLAPTGAERELGDPAGTTERCFALDLRRGVPGTPPAAGAHGAAASG